DRGPGRRATSRRGPPDQPGGRCYHAVYRLMRRQTARWWRSRTHERMSKVLPFKSRGLRNELREAMQQRTPVRLEREPIQHGVLHGYVIGLSSDFCLIAEIGDAMRLDGYLVVAVGDITHLEVDPAREFVDKALALRGETLRIPDEFRLDDWAAIAHSASACAPLLSINMIEDDEGEISYVGQYAGLEENLLILREMDPNAH